ncbi:methyltransferase-like protein [Senna tora]|uniref:Methyltransferase-like protein n=1 Tax=Senna tora TaxID=362788 RepID=A0A834WAJ6_9FABA|nr:methyltransferase-like protein [Senna tora]
MCPLRILLIFLSATLAGFFVLRNLRSQPLPTHTGDDDDVSASANPSNPQTTTVMMQVKAAIESGFWTFVDMASGRYLWRHMVSSSKRSS